MNKENLDALKKLPPKAAHLTYKLKNANVYVSAEGYHFTDYLDPVEEISPEIDASQLTDDESSYIETQLQANSKRFKSQASVLKKHLSLKHAKVLDIGCGGGLFLSLLKDEGAEVAGIELSDSRAQYTPKQNTILKSISVRSKPNFGRRSMQIFSTR
jgi:SAM-dependent methyltransferase